MKIKNKKPISYKEKRKNETLEKFVEKKEVEKKDATNKRKRNS